MQRPCSVAVLLLTLGVTAGVARADIVIGVAAPLSGEFALLGKQIRDGAAQAVADINDAGGVNGEPLILEAMDDGCSAKKADAVANQLAGKGAAMVVGHLCLKASITASSVYAAEHIVEISPGTTFPKFTDERPGPGIFRLAGRDDVQGAFAGVAIAARFKDKNIAIVDDRTAYGKALAEAARAAMNAAGKQETLTDSYDPGAKDYETLVSRLADSAIDVLYLGGASTEAALIAREMRARGMDTVLVSGDALFSTEYGKLAGDAADGTLVTYAPDPRRYPEAATVAAAFAASGVDPAGYVLPAYAAVQVWAAAASAARSGDFDKVVAAISERTFATVIGSVSFDAKGDLREVLYDWYVWRDGTYSETVM